MGTIPHRFAFMATITVLVFVIVFLSGSTRAQQPAPPTVVNETDQKLVVYFSSPIFDDSPNIDVAPHSTAELKCAGCPPLNLHQVVVLENSGEFREIGRVFPDNAQVATIASGATIHIGYDRFHYVMYDERRNITGVDDSPQGSSTTYVRNFTSTSISLTVVKTSGSWIVNAGRDLSSSWSLDLNIPPDGTYSVTCLNCSDSFLIFGLKLAPRSLRAGSEVAIKPSEYISQLLTMTELPASPPPPPPRPTPVCVVAHVGHCTVDSDDSVGFVAPGTACHCGTYNGVVQ
ncbi:MAG TPA: hypothetical protein VMH86_06235 [Rhizomicrobium sp.]|nr:hypothetical protein [Rhizomicrobium sp.]